MVSNINETVNEFRAHDTRRKIFIASALIIILVVVSLGLIYLPYNKTSQATSLSYGMTDNIPYGLLDYTDTENLMFSQQSVIPAMCASPGTIKCSDPIIVSYFTTNAAANISRYEQNVHMILKNTGKTVRVESMELQNTNSLCTYIGGAFDMASGSSSERIDFFCIKLSSAQDFNGTWALAYLADGIKNTTGGALQSV
ncbi:MAG: hypothetical protein AABX14_01470 [Candidatus Aenigmatarchaeota archaeon]|mgnify:CR=1 FL=1